MSHYYHSHPVSTAELKKWGVFTTMEVRNHNQEELAYQGSREFIEDASKAWDYPITWKACSQDNGHLMALSVPECLPERLGLLSAICDMSFLQDDMFENTTDDQRATEGKKDSGAFNSLLEQKGLPFNSLTMFPQLKKTFMKSVLAKDPDLASWIPQEVDRVATAPPRDRMTYDTLESYMTERLRDVSMKWFYALCAYGMDLKLTEKEKEQSYLPTLAMEKAIIYTNDLYSWNKEKIEQEAVAADKDMFSAVAVLMKELKISELEALDVLREKTLEAEKEHFAAVADLEAAGPLSDTFYRYLDMTRLCHSGGMLWSAVTDRYNKVGDTQVNDDLRTQNQLFSVVSTSTQDSVNAEVPTSKPNNSSHHNPDMITNGNIQVDQGLPNSNGTAVVTDPRDCSHSVQETIEVRVDRMTLKDAAKDAGTPVAAF